MIPSEKETTQFQKSPAAEIPEWIAVPKWIRVKLGHETAADSRKVMLMRDMPPVYYFPKNHVKLDFLKGSDRRSEDEKLGQAVYWHVEAGGKKAENAAWCYEKPGKGAPAGISDYIAFDWEAMDTWMEEDEEVYSHPRDPYSRIDLRYSSRHVKININGRTLAESHSPVILFETGLPARYYLHPTDVRMDLLKPTDFHTGCPYKGMASYYSIVVDGEEMKNLVWTYKFPYPELAKIQGLLCFYHEKIGDFFIDRKRLPDLK